MPNSAQLPAARGVLSSYVLEVLSGRREGRGAMPGCADCALTDEDLHLALYLCYELHYAGLPGVSDDLEWDEHLLRLRRRAEHRFEAVLRDLTPGARGTAPRDLVPALCDAVGGPSMSMHVREHATVAQLREFVVHRSAYQLKEADPHTWTLPRLTGPAKQHLARIQAGEYGADHDDHVVHAELFAQTMGELGIDNQRHVHLDALPGVSLAVSNLASMLGLHRRLRAASIGHLALSETTSVAAMRNYVAGLHRLAVSAQARKFYEVHVLADEEHGIIALDMVQALVDEDRQLVDDVAFGIGASLVVERAFATHVLDRWASEETSLRRPLAA
ncbi:iron-containing redox enzyme family protein [soil metagenome]